jgi:hypothetical protein
VDAGWIEIDENDESESHGCAVSNLIWPVLKEGKNPRKKKSKGTKDSSRLAIEL